MANGSGRGFAVGRTGIALLIGKDMNSECI